MLCCSLQFPLTALLRSIDLFTLSPISLKYPRNIMAIQPIMLFIMLVYLTQAFMDCLFQPQNIDRLNTVCILCINYVLRVTAEAYMAMVTTKSLCVMPSVKRSSPSCTGNK